jgi:hypothetical protein
VAREGKACAGLAGRDAAYVEEAADFGCVVGGGGEVTDGSKPIQRILNAKPINSNLLIMLHTKTPREQNGRDSFGRYRAQARSAAIAALSILQGKEIDRVYCDLHDDFVVRINEGTSALKYVFYQVKTNGKQNHNWTLNEVLGIKTKKELSNQNPTEIKDSFIGKLLLHTIIFDSHCNGVIFQTNIHCDDNIAELLQDIEGELFSNKYSQLLIDKFNDLYKDHISGILDAAEIKKRLAKLRFETDVQYLKNGEENFEPIARNKVYAFSEIDLGHAETKEILLKLLALVEKKSSGVISQLTQETIEEQAGISIDDLLSILSISKDAYQILLAGGDLSAIRSASIIQRTLLASGAGMEQVSYCSKCKTDWDLWVRKNRHTLSPLDFNTIANKVISLVQAAQQNGNVIGLSNLRVPIKQSVENLKQENLLYDLTEDLILGGIFSELVKGKA